MQPPQRKMILRKIQIRTWKTSRTLGNISLTFISSSSCLWLSENMTICWIFFSLLFIFVVIYCFFTQNSELCRDLSLKNMEWNQEKGMWKCTFKARFTILTGLANAQHGNFNINNSRETKSDNSTKPLRLLS